MNTCTSLIQHLYRNYDFSGSDDDFLGSMMNKLCYGCYVTILFSSNKLLKLKYIHYFISKISNEKNHDSSYGLGNTVSGRLNKE
jgi:hypothetical protein